MSNGIMGRVKAWAASDRAEARSQADQADRNDARIKARVTDAGRTAYNSARAPASRCRFMNLARKQENRGLREGVENAQ
jgi:hypothetical protein